MKSKYGGIDTTLLIISHEIGVYLRSDDILRRVMNISVGVVDSGLGSGWGININSTDAEIERVAEQFIKMCK